MSLQDRMYARMIAGISAGFLAVYSTSVLYYVATSADLGVRCLLANDSPDQSGVQVRQVSFPDQGELPGLFGEAPAPGDLLIRIGDREVRTFADYADSLRDMRQAFRRSSTYDSRVHDANPLDIDRYASLPVVIDYSTSGGSRASAEGERRPEVAPTNRSEGAGSSEETTTRGRNREPGSRGVQHGRYVRIEFIPHGETESQKAWLRIQTLPVVEVILSIVWCLLELGIFLVAALALCHRPSDRATRVFFGLCFITLPAFVGGYHWWVIAASPWLTFPFVLCAVLLPVVTLHFYLNYPSRHWLRERGGMPLLFGLYSLPVLMVLTLTFLLATSYAARWTPGLASFQPLLLFWVRQVVDVYIVLALGYYSASVYCMYHNYRHCQQTSERKQMQWILGAAVFATPLVLYAVYLAFADRVGLVLGRGRIPMVLVSLLFLTAYAIGILRYRLMLLEQMVSRHTLYLVLSQLVSLMYSVLIAVGSLLTVYRGLSVPEQLAPLILIFIALILAMGWLRDRAQHLLDRRFFREKYRLDRAMQQMNLVVAQVADVRSLADHMLRSCREVLQVRFSALYLRDGKGANFDLVCAVGGRNLPPRLLLDAESMQMLEVTGSCQRILGNWKGTAPLLQQLHRQLNSQLMHGFEVDGALTGLVVLGSKSSTSPFTAEDTTFVSAIGQMTGVALQCVRVQQNVSRLDGILQDKVRKIESQERQIAILRNQLASEQQRSEPKAVIPSDSQAFDVGLIRGRSPALLQVLHAARKVAGSDSSVLIRGESGTGKELLATALHRNSKRLEGPLVCVNCAALSPALLESELFGHVKGAFTGAYRDTEGRFQRADGGTLFLDEIGDVPLDVQVKLLRVLQERKFEPVGSRESVSVDVRLIAATHQNLEQLMREGKFREDLYYRLNVITLHLPPLRERKEDIFELALAFLNDAAEQSGKTIRDIDDLAYRALVSYHWPGNIRELHNAIQRGVLLAESDVLLLENLPVEVQQAEYTEFDLAEQSGLLTDPTASGRSQPKLTESRSTERAGKSPQPFRVHTSGSESLPPLPPSASTAGNPESTQVEGPAPADSTKALSGRSAVEERSGRGTPPRLDASRPDDAAMQSGFSGSSANVTPGEEREQLVEALARSRGNKAQAARLLGLPRSTFYSKLKKYKL